MVLSFEYLDWKGRRGGWRLNKGWHRRGREGFERGQGATWDRLIAFSVKFMRSEPIRWEIRTEPPRKKGKDWWMGREIEGAGGGAWQEYNGLL